MGMSEIEIKRTEACNLIKESVITNGDGTSIVLHKTLEEIATNYGITYTFEFICGNADSAVYKCIARDPATGVVSEQIGEASGKNLETDISKKYPHIMASKRAYDRAVLRVMGLFNIYSDEEIPVNTKVPTTGPAPTKNQQKKSESRKSANPAPAAAPIDIDAVLGKDAVPVTGPEKSSEETKAIPTPKKVTAPPDVPVNMDAITTSGNADISSFLAPTTEDDDEIEREIEFKKEKTGVADAAETEIQPEETSEQDIQPANEATADRPDFLNCIVKVGKHKPEGLTFEQLYHQHRDSFDWILRFATSTSGIFAEQAKVAKKVKDYLEAKAG